MKQALLNISILGLVLLSGCEQNSSDCEVRLESAEKDIENLKVEKYSLERDLEALKEKAAANQKTCSLVSSIEKSVEDRKEAMLRHEQKQQEIANAKSAAQERKLARARSGPMTLTEWRDVLIKKSKAEVVDIIGPPPSLIRPRGSSVLINEVWTYPGKVQPEERPNERWSLVLQIYQEEVQSVDGKRQ